ncbi:hypothetical protein ACG7TL_006459 [Trametes sanguinea]
MKDDITPTPPRSLSFPHTKMIFTTVLVTCLVALMGALQQVPVDTLFATLAHFDTTPALSSFTATVLHLTGSITRLTLDAAPLAEVDWSLSRTLADGVTYGGALAYLGDLGLPDFSAVHGLSFSDTSNKNSVVLPRPISEWCSDCGDEDGPRAAWIWSRLPTLATVGWWAYRFGVLCLATAIVLAAESPECKRAFADEVLPLFRRLTVQYDIALNDLAPPYHQHDTSLRSQHIVDMTPASEPTYSYCPPSLSTTPNFANTAAETDADAQTPQTRSRPSTVFGHARCSGPFTPVDEEGADEDAEADTAYDAYLCRALNIARDTSGEPPLEGWYRDDDDPAVTGHDAGGVDAWTPLDALSGLPREHAVLVDAG